MSRQVGRSVPRVDALRKVTGEAQFIADIRLPGMLHMAVLRSPLPHARIARIDVSAAAALPGVAAVATAENALGLLGHHSVQDCPIFAAGVVRFVGEPVAAVAALDEETARAAVNCIDAEYDELPAVFDAREAMAADAPLIHPDLGSYRHSSRARPRPGTNVCNHFRLRRGDAAAGFAAADRVFEHEYHTPMVSHVALETHGAIVRAARDGSLAIWAPCQSPYHTRTEVAAAFGLPLSQVRVTVPYVGGAFGGKQSIRIEPVVAAVARLVPGRPVRWILTREESFVNTVVRHGSYVRIRTGVRAGGTITAREMELVWDAGAYADTSPQIAYNTAFSGAGPYAIPNVEIDSYAVYTNKPVSGAYRGFGAPETAWAVESHTDTMAAELGLSPLEFRLRNGLEEGSVSITGETMLSVGLKDSLRLAAQAVNPDQPPERDAAGRLVGRGAACFYKYSGTPSASAVTVKLNEDGSAGILTSATELGQGLHTVLAQMVAEELGIAPEWITVENPDTEVTPYERSTTASRSTFHTGNAVRLAAREVRQQICEQAALLLEAHPDDLEVSGGRVFVKNTPGRGLVLADLWAGGHYPTTRPIQGQAIFSTAGVYDPIDPETMQSGRPSAFWMYGAQAVEVAVDPETGVYEVRRIAAAHDVGRAINPQAAHGQIIGGAVMGYGPAVMEELVFDAGRIVNPSLADYKVPCIADAPEVLPLLVEAHHPEGPYGAKGVAEQGTVPIAPAIANAVAQATGVRIPDLPITPEKVWRALKARSERGEP